MGVLNGYPYFRSPEGKRMAAIVAGVTVLAYVTMIGIRGDVARSEGNAGNDNGQGYDAIGAVREAERRVQGKHVDMRGKDMSAPKWV
ncbi:hypothetical protein M413DRAFT_440524 [Hebeloma cylindrosporum]|uniref:Uncharacterized protein n=1 Tax=Hebeloma cylindrosporum TaxID=76867 RepID=A0A0C2Z1A4_HEBCY|nr:hypothetical protein M413DRAFT_440524 [Hebeloma cylindrosporum h7]